MALAMGAQKYHLVAPVMTTENVVLIRQGRHLLQEMAVATYIPNDCELQGGSGSNSNGRVSANTQDRGNGSDDSQSMLILTGPNFSGKSVYLKQNALIVYLAHIGSYVPAEKAIIGITDRILTRIATRESVSKNQSAFMIDLQQIALSISQATRRSLVIVDEFGKGTNSLDGAGLAAGVFNYFLDLGAECPKVLAATHFHEIFENNFLVDHPRLSFGYMAVHVDPHSEDLREQVNYLFQFTAGRSSSSFGATCARMNGIDEAMVARAEDLILLASRGEDLVNACSKLDVGKVKDLEHAESVGRSFLALDFDMDKRRCSAMLNDIMSIDLE